MASEGHGEMRARIVKALRDPRSTLRLAMALLRGRYYRAKFRILGRRVIIGRRFRVVGRLDIRGPGTVIFGDDCGIVSSRMATTTPWTHSPEAVIKFGNRVLLTGTRFGCENRIEIGDMGGLSDARIMDTDFHSMDVQDDRPRYSTRGRSKPVILGRNVWVGAGAMVLKGVRIGDNAVVAAGAVVVANVPANAVVLGNPARVVTRVQRTDGPRAGIERPRDLVPTASAKA
jgi:acetyltransferase-like isoleucine patch superfamily enzyme